MTVNEQIKKGNYRFVTVIYKNFILKLRQKNKILKIPEGIGKMPIKTIETKKEGEVIIYV